MNAPFGIDHPLIAVHDIEQLRDRLMSMGFNMTPIGKHPWGTSTSLAMFNGCLIEIMGIFDDSLIDEVPAGDFHFGRHVHEHLMQREGVALTALHSTDSQADARKAQAAGFELAGHLEFGRDVTLPDGSEDRTKTTLALLPDARWPRLSFFLCQQHRPELIYVPEWLAHPNTVHGICGITILAEPDSQEALVGKFSALYGAADKVEGGYRLQSANGKISLLSSQAIETESGALPQEILADGQPGIVGMDLRYANADALRHHLQQGDTPFDEADGVFRLPQARSMGNMLFRFYPQGR
ncbi:VOC family protein [Granulosicoccus sp. 3-233]|uniref:VOC family protein n=1 Tax=Granulosicoccus sp. 3-233 TaxID=3417969 RepID=UPI003D3591BD